MNVRRQLILSAYHQLGLAIDNGDERLAFVLLKTLESMLMPERAKPTSPFRQWLMASAKLFKIKNAENMDDAELLNRISFETQMFLKQHENAEED